MRIDSTTCMCQLACIPNRPFRLATARDRVLSGRLARLFREMTGTRRLDAPADFPDEIIAANVA
ncbi:hypothetical protein GGD83_002040 [Rhodoblastus sphagnicola]|uniref:hypothetical protein n=1 Tax=Rhodoblastus sphagnicola TaxID=333368 RepID=UPI0011B0DA60|nr:hypothetical protein [Rhodoblastus sphagnicola]MBB4198240.1 hypothetical protein [Rhodoblastus sphagnicola]